MASKGEALAAKLLEMRPADRLRLAAGLIEQGDLESARIIAKTVVEELTLIKLFPNVLKRKEEVKP